MAMSELIIYAVIFGGGLLLCLVWMLLNLLSVMRREGLSSDFRKRMLQTREILLKPALTFFALGGIGSAYLFARSGMVAQ